MRTCFLFQGDMMGPFIDNLEGNMQMPTGCGEQNMITLIPSVFVAKYLISINRFSADTRQRVAKYCGRGNFTVQMNIHMGVNIYTMFITETSFVTSSCFPIQQPLPVKDYSERKIFLYREQFFYL